MSVERPDSVPVVSDIYNVDFAQLFRLGTKPIADQSHPLDTISKEPEEDSNSESEK